MKLVIPAMETENIQVLNLALTVKEKDKNFVQPNTYPDNWILGSSSPVRCKNGTHYDPKGQRSSKVCYNCNGSSYYNCSACDGYGDIKTSNGCSSFDGTGQTLTKYGKLVN